MVGTCGCFHFSNGAVELTGFMHSALQAVDCECRWLCLLGGCLDVCALPGEERASKGFLVFTQEIYQQLQCKSQSTG